MNHPQANLFEQFLRERTYLKNVTPSTLIWYLVAFKNYGAAFPDEILPTRVSLQRRRRGCPGRRRAIPERPRRYRSYASTTIRVKVSLDPWYAGTLYITMRWQY